MNTEHSLNELTEKSLRSFSRYNNTENSADINISSSPIVELVNLIINSAIFRNISDIHFEPADDNLRIRMRLDGILEEYALLPQKLHAPIIARIKIISGMNTVEKRKPQDGSFSYQYKNKIIDIRLSVIPSIHGEKLVMRLLNTMGRCYSIDELELSHNNETVFRKLFQRSSGLILNTGPVNSGKTATLYAALSELNTIDKNIVTIEDPVEYKLDNITQIQINEKIGLTFEAGLRTILRQDPNIILIGEIRDEKTAATAVRAALTGHLVFSTLHTGNAVNAILRMLDMKAEPYLLSEALAGCLGQRLLRRICPHCKKPYQPTAEEEKIFLQKYHLGVSYYGEGCEICSGRGYLGRIAAQEIFTVTNTMREAICARASSSVLRRIALKNGMVPLLHDVLAKITQGKTTIKEVMRVLNEDE